MTLSLQYSTQWDSLAHVGASSMRMAMASTRPCTTTAFAPGSDSVGPADAAGDGGGHRSFARRLGIEHMACHGVQGRGVLVDLAHHSADECEIVDS